MLSNRAIRRSINLSIASAISWSFFGASIGGPVLAGLYLALRLDNFQIGLINSMGTLFLPFQIIGVLVQQRYFKRKYFWFTVIFSHYFAFLLIGLLVLFWPHLNRGAGVMMLVLLFALSQAVVQLAASVWFTWLGDIVPAKENNSFWNRRAGLSQLTMLLASISVGVLIDWWGRDSRLTYAYIIFIGLVFAYISLYFNMCIPDPDIAVRGSRQPLLVRFRLIWRNPQFRRLVYFFGTQAIAGSLIGPFIFVYMQKSLNYNMFTIQALSAISCLISFFATYAFTVIGKKFGRKPIVLLCTFLKGIEFLTWAILLPGFGWTWALPAFILGGFVNMGLATSSLSLITSLGNKKEQGFLIAFYFSIIGIISFASAFFSGFVYDALGSLHIYGSYTLSPFNVLAIIVAIFFFFSVFLFSAYKEEGAESTVNVVKKLLARNPFLAVYHAHILASPLTEKNRIDALDKAESNLVVSELLSDLYNPSSRVRESAVKNIARKGLEADPKLETELLRILDYPELGIQAATAAALGHLQSVKAIPALARFLREKDITMAQTCIKALANIGTAAAVAELTAALSMERCRILWPYVAEALGELADYKVSRKLYSAYAGETSPILKKQMLIALGRTFATERAGIFAAFANEDKKPGTALEEMINYFSQHFNEQNDLAARLNELLDKEHFVNILEKVIYFWFNSHDFLKPMLTTGNIDKELSAMFNKKGEINNPSLLRDEYSSVAAWTIVNLWTELKYSHREFNRYVLLASMLIIKSAMTNHHHTIKLAGLMVTR